MKIYFRNFNSISSKALEIYKSFAAVVDRGQDADVIVLNDFRKFQTDKMVIMNSTAVDHITSPRIISLRDVDPDKLSDLTAVSEFCLAMMINLMRSFNHQEIKGKTLGVIGYGRIGKKLARHALHHEMRIMSVDRENSKDDLIRLISDSDVVSLHITASQENKNFMNHEKFSYMKRNSVFLNSARPELVDLNALQWALDSLSISSWFDFDLDIQHDRLITTPHLGGSTKESKEKSEILIAEKVKELFITEKL